MRMKAYPTIDELSRLQKRFAIHVQVVEGQYLAETVDYAAVLVTISGKEFQLYLDDEYRDLEVGNPLLDLCLVLRELEDYAFHDDYLVWCTAKGLDSSNESVRAYHMGLRKTYTQVKAVIGQIKSYVSDYDFELNAGAAQALREHRDGPTT